MLEVGTIVLCEDLRDTLLSFVRLLKFGHHIALDPMRATGTFLSKDSMFSLKVCMAGDVFSLEPVIPGPVAEVNFITRSQAKQEEQTEMPAAAATAESSKAEESSGPPSRSQY